MSKVDDFISNINEELRKEKKQALSSVKRAKLEKEMKSHSLGRELSALEDRAGKLKRVVLSINKQSAALMDNLRVLREQKRQKRLRLVELKRDVSRLKGVDKEIIPLQKRVKELIFNKEKKRKVLSVKRRNNNIQSAALRRKERELEILKSTLNPMQTRIRGLILKKDEKQKLRKDLTEQARKLQSRLTNLVVSLNNLKKKQIDPLHHEIASLVRRKRDKEIVHLKLRSIVSRLQRSVNKHSSSLNNLEKVQKAIEARIAEFGLKIREKEGKQRRLLSIKDEIPMAAKRIIEFGRQERDLVKKKMAVLDLKHKVRSAQERKQQQKKKLQETVRKLREQERKLKKLSL